MTSENKSIARSFKIREVVVRRIYLAGIAITVSCVTGVMVVASAGAATKHTPKPKPKPVKISTSCAVSETIAAPSGATDVVPPVNQGTAYGTARCGTLGSGVQSVSLLLDDSGNYTGTYWHYLKRGAIYGDYTLVPQPGLPSTGSTFASASFIGTLTITGGTGAFKGATGKGTTTCSSPDSVHLSCSEKLKLKLPPVLAKA
jgi:hypothetical protein